MSFPEMRYLLAFPGTLGSADEFEEAAAKLKAEGFEFTGDVEEIRTIAYFKFSFIKRERKNE